MIQQLRTRREVIARAQGGFARSKKNDNLVAADL